MLEMIEGVYENGPIQIDRPPHNTGDRTQASRVGTAHEPFTAEAKRL